ncbi:MULTISPECIES: helix-turn-helix domain-containing protein [unclassified Acidiphilium]|uniref:helix-turn-helix domain-containing protein n=1 Tax=unclassified Acidiphilium TaxID=2617493 RepID=UPI0025BF1528|nr:MULTISPECIES: helix-turn-helix domain-containing protein [unclassified Acidiphilium]HQT62690.1 helix-turn-helix domain-containing protein [Acidiphilium sp.]
MSYATFDADVSATADQDALGGSVHGHRAPNDRLMPLRDVADQLDVSLSTLRRRIAEGALRVHRIGRAIRVSHADLGAFLAASRSEKP